MNTFPGTVVELSGFIKSREVHADCGQFNEVSVTGNYLFQHGCCQTRSNFTGSLFLFVDVAHALLADVV